MKCATVKAWLGAGNPANIPPDMARHIEQCPDCRQEAKRTAMLCRMLAFKQYEKPSPEMTSRCIRGVRDRLAAIEAQAERAGALGRITPFTLPAMRFALAALFLMMLGAHVFLMTPTPSLESQLAHSIPVVRQVAYQPAPATTNIASMPPYLRAPGMRYNGGMIRPAGIQYGTQPSEIVRYDY